MEELIRQIAAGIALYFQENENQVDLNSRRNLTSFILRALQSTRGLFEERFGGPIRFRCARRNAGNLEQCEMDGIDVLEYLIDFSFSRFSIPQAIGDQNAQNIQNISYQMVFAAESELGTRKEVCRDLLKLLDVRSFVRCLLFRHRVRNTEADQLKSSILDVLRNHALIEETMHGWLFVGLDVQGGNVFCHFYTLGDNLDDLVIIEAQA